jgi:hypothetical protein
MVWSLSALWGEGRDKVCPFTSVSPVPGTGLTRMLTGVITAVHRWRHPTVTHLGGRWRVLMEGN